MERFEIKPELVVCSDIQSETAKTLDNIRFDKLFVLTDSQTNKACLPLIADILPEKTFFIEIQNGEENKTLASVEKIWLRMFEENAGRDALLLNLGGGMVCDAGGFAASVYKRGIPFINIPTSLLAQVDAAAGGKNGINFSGIKNSIGTFTFPEKTIVSPEFLKSLPDDEFLCGLAEMLKHGLIADKQHFEQIVASNAQDHFSSLERLIHLIRRSIEIKTYFTDADPYEKNIRKALNFGHTFGHAFEEFYMNTAYPMKHGFAVAHGMICELYVSHKKCGLELQLMLKIIGNIYDSFGSINFSMQDIPQLIHLMKQDKKNFESKINCTSVENIGSYRTDQLIDEQTVLETLTFYKQIML